MVILLEKKEVHFNDISLEELAYAIENIRSNPEFDNFKIMIDGFDEETIGGGELCIS